MKKKIFTLFTALTLSAGALFASDTAVGGIYYDFDDANLTATVTYRGSFAYEYANEYTGNVVIPTTVTYYGKTYSVTSIGEAAFLDCSGLTSITIPDSVTSIGDYAFRDCSGLTSVTIPNSVTSIGNGAFSGTTWLANQPDGVIYINQSLYKYKGEMPANTSIVVRDGTTQICGYAFSGCSGLTSVTIPNSVTSIGRSAFEGTTWLANQPDGVIYINQSFYKYKGNMPANTSIVVREGTTQICGGAFSGCTGLTSITIPNSVTSIDASVFSGCSGLTSVTIGNSVESIGEYAFYNCSGLTSVTIGNSVTSIDENAFENCSNLTSVVWNAKKYLDFSDASYAPFYAISSKITSFTFGNEVEHIPAYLCRLMNNLTSLTLPNSVTSIGGYAFAGCIGLTSVTIPNSVTSIGEGAFSGCSSLTSVVWNAKNCADFSSSPFSYSSITSFTFGDAVEHIPAYLCCGLSTLNAVTIGNSVGSIGSSAFYGCSGLTSITIPNSVTSIEYSAFRGCSGLTSIIVKSGNPTYDSRDNCNAIIETATNTLIVGCQSTIIPNSVTSIGSYAFSGCSRLTSVTIPNSVTSIGDEAFFGCSRLTSVVWNAKNCNGLWSSYKEAPFYEIASQITSFTFGDEVEIIPDYLCDNMSSLTSVTIPESVTSIGASVFFGCRNLASIAIPNSVTSIGKMAFDNCYSLASVTLSENLTSIEYSMFYNCSSLTSLIIPNSITSIGNEAFYGCNGLTSITCGTITPPACGEGVFTGVSSGTVVHIPCGATEAYQNANGWNGLKQQEPPMPDYTITVRTIDTQIGQAELQSRKQNFDCEAVASFSATPNLGYHFVQWSDGNTDNPRTVTLTQDTTLTAMFAKDYSGKCGDNLYWQYKDNGLYITGFGTMYNYTETTQPWLLLADSIHTIYTDNTATSIGEYAFANLGKLTQLRLGVDLETVGANAFAGCLRLGNIHCYAALPPLAEESSFANYNARLYVPCEVLGDYQLAIVFGNFKYIDCISSDGVDVPNNTVTVTPSTNDATFTWPSNNNANAYTLEITKDGVVFCTLTFNANGQLMGIAFAPGVNGPAAAPTTSGFQFTVTGLDEASHYTYTFDAKDADGGVIQHYAGEFNTDGYVGLGQIKLAEICITNGRIVCEGEFRIYDLLGRDVTRLNGSLCGVYVVKSGNAAVKVVVK